MQALILGRWPVRTGGRRRAGGARRGDAGRGPPRRWDARVRRLRGRGRRRRRVARRRGPGQRRRVDRGRRAALRHRDDGVGRRPARVAELLRARGAAAVAASNFSPGALVFAQLVETAARLTARLPGYEPYIVEWHRHAKADRPSGTARDLARRILAVDPARDRIATPSDGPAEAGHARGGRRPGGNEPGPAPRGLRRARRGDRAQPDRPGPRRLRLWRRRRRRLAPRRAAACRPPPVRDRARRGRADGGGCCQLTPRP